jgi:hypothetical protein
MSLATALGIIGIGILLWLLVALRDARDSRETLRRIKEEDRKRDQLRVEAKRLRDEFLFLKEMSAQDDNLMRRAAIARQLGYIYGHDVWFDLQPGCHLVKRNAQAGTDNFYWLRADEVLREVTSQLRTYEELRDS